MTGCLRAAIACGALLATLASAASASAAVQVFFPRGEQLVAVQRPGTTVDDALKALLRGPTAEERRAGFRTFIPRGTAVRSVKVAGARVTIDFGPKIMQGLNAEGSTRGSRRSSSPRRPGASPRRGS